MRVSEQQRSLAGYLEEVASASPAPGGGSVAAIVGALAAGLGEMVTNLSVDRGQDAENEATLRQAREQLAELRQRLVAAATADEVAYEAYRTAAKLPRGDDSEKRIRRAAMQAALVDATEVPLSVARAATDVARALESVSRLGNRHLRSDAALGAILSEAALQGALLNVRGNAALLRDEPRAETYRGEADHLEAAGRASAQRAYNLAMETL